MFEKLKIEKMPDSEVVITGELTLECLNKARPAALRHLNDHIKIPGFRSGNIPENILAKNVGEMRVLEEVAEVALANEYPNIMHEAKLSPIGRPEVAITKLAPGIPLEFKITITLEPEFTLPDYKKIAKEVKSEDSLDVTDEEKKHRAKEMKRLTIVEDLVKATKVKIPKLLIDNELNKMLSQFQEDVVRHGMKWDEYLKSIKKTEDDIRAEWKEKAEHRAKAELILMKIADAEKLEPTNEELEHETEHLLTHYKDADPLRLRIYVYQMMKNQKVLEFLETQSTLI